MDFYRINEEYNIFLQRYEKEKRGVFGTLKGHVMNLKNRSAESTITGDIDLSQTINIGAIAAINEGSISKCEAGANKNYSVTVG